MVNLGTGAYLLSHRICKSAVRHTAMGTCFPHETSPRASISRGTNLGAELHRSHGLTAITSVGIGFSKIQLRDSCVSDLERDLPLIDLRSAQEERSPRGGSA